jgi:hypothetical protein
MVQRRVCCHELSLPRETTYAARPVNTELHLSDGGPAGHVPDREVRWRRHDDQIVEVVIDMTDDTIVSAWITRVNT